MTLLNQINDCIKVLGKQDVVYCKQQIINDNNEYNVKINYFAKKLEDLIEEDKDKKKVINLGIFGLMYAEEIQQFAIDAEKKLGSVCNDITNKANIGNFTGELYKYVNAMLHFENKNLEDSEKINTKLMKYQGKNTIFYGVPGCGKSRMLDKVVLDGVGAGFKKRVLFHPEYTYSDFVGQTMPVVRDGKITYEFVPGPFTEILKQAIKDKSLQENYYLIIEEINRGNAPAIFGDLFQLLDRKNGRSEYEITNKAIADWVYKDTENFGKDSVYIPSNLTLFATMNTCDQNVFTMDTAFKRRWKMVRVKNGFDDNECASFLNWKIDGLPFTWKEFATVVNDLILKCNDGVNAEDKQLGAYFVKEDEITDINAFAEKVLMYLWEDVVRYDKTQMFDSRFNTLDKVISGFCIGENVFVGDEMAKLYSRMSEEINADQA